MSLHTRRYVPCEKPLDVYPFWTLCDRPADPKTCRCPLHPIKRLWPEEGEAHEA